MSTMYRCPNCGSINYTVQSEDDEKQIYICFFDKIKFAVYKE